MVADSRQPLPEYVGEAVPDEPAFEPTIPADQGAVTVTVVSAAGGNPSGLSVRT
jgi:hypothetical protein